MQQASQKEQSQPEHNCPVARTSHLIKIFEKILAKNIIETHQKMNPKQHGFLSGRSCLSQLLKHCNKILEEFEKSNNVDVIYYSDFTKAFDRVNHIILLNKLKTFVINGKISVWIHNFQSNRQQCVAVSGTTSSEAQVRRGIPQGSVLGPLLFLIHISDINYEIVDSAVSCFANDHRILLGKKMKRTHRCYKMIYMSCTNMQIQII